MVEQPHDGILLSNKKDWRTDACTTWWALNTRGKWQKPDTEEHMDYSSVYVTRPEQAPGAREAVGNDWSWGWGFFLGHESALELDTGDGCTILRIY